MKTTSFRFRLFFIAICVYFSKNASAQEGALNAPKESRSDLSSNQRNFLQHAGMPAAASKIYFTDASFAVSGFGEMMYNYYLGQKNTSSGDLQLYYTNLYRFITYLAYKPVTWLVVYAEVFGEFIHDGNRESDWEIFTETFLDFLISKHLNVRLGSSQVQIGFINNNDEPVLYFSVNRPEVERIIIPSQWIDFGLMTYGQIVENLNYSLSLYDGLDAHAFRASTWIRGGRNNQFRWNWHSPVLNTQIEYRGLPNTILSMSGIYSMVGHNNYVQIDQKDERVNANTLLLSSYIRNEWSRLTLMALGTYGWMKNTERVFLLTQNQVLGSQVYGYYFECGYDILPFFRKKPDERPESKVKNFIFRSDQLRLPVFFRYERLNTHAKVVASLENQDYTESNLHALVIGMNFNTRNNIVFKTNYQFRWNKQILSGGEVEGNRLEMGFGFIF